MIGTKLAHYEITSHLGTGGMGEVYQAVDSKLGRRVAIKVLPAAFASDADRLSRFRREAQALALLNHPNIAQIYGLEESGDTRCIVMELIEGESLHERIQKGRVPIDEALAIAKQIAEALEAAHERGIVHRDLKPGNVMLTADGRVKVLDFGLAKTYNANRVNETTSNSPTISSLAATNAGIILGTASYMSPEQARGKSVDASADIWAFGVVLFEMLSGQRAFPGEDVTDTLASVVKLDPKWDSLGEDVSSRVRQVLRLCLRKDPKQRPHCIADVRMALDGSFETVAPSTMAAPSRARLLLTVGAAAFAGALAVVLWTSQIQRPAPEPVQRTSVMLPVANPIVVAGSPLIWLAISTDGSELVYTGENTEALPSRRQLFIRSLHDLKVRPLPGTEGAVNPFFSPDGQWVGFFTNTGELKKVPVAGGNSLTLLNKLNGSQWAFGDWVDPGNIVFGLSTGKDGLQRISSDGGSPRSITSPDPGNGDLRHTAPHLIPSTRTVLFTVVNADPTKNRVESVSLDTGERRVILEKASGAHYLNSGHLLFRRGEVLLVAPFDPKKLTPMGPEVPLRDEIRRDVQNVPEFAVSSGGTLAYVSALNDALLTLGSVGRDGMFQPFPNVPPNRLDRPAVSPTGQYIAFMVAGGGTGNKIQIYDVGRRTLDKLTQEGADAIIAWHPNGREIAVASTRQNSRGLYLKDLNGSERLLVEVEQPTLFRPGSWSPDGKLLAYSLQKGNDHDIWIVGEDGKSPHAFLSTPAAEFNPMFSPDGKWLAYISDKSGRNEIYVKAYPDGDEIPVSTGGATGPVWSHDKKAIFYMSSADGSPRLYEVSAIPERKTLRLGDPVKVLDLRVPSANGAMEQYTTSTNAGNSYDILSDGRFVMIRGPDVRSREIVVVQNWIRELEGK
jgi:serine/threonine-protein kinase